MKTRAAAGQMQHLRAAASQKLLRSTSGFGWPVHTEPTRGQLPGTRKAKVLGGVPNEYSVPRTVGAVAYSLEHLQLQFAYSLEHLQLVN